ncbi:MAG: methyltetrahydrofolate--corrinoid methyltransferase [Planctomycetes bacterium]|nr:methyltetrahydrofolate--corrinoid methyltransferase [Planctomycetota bacterium]
MLAIGERINGMFQDVKKAIQKKDKKVIQDLAVKQTQAGAAFLDVNVGTAAQDQEGTMKWLIETIQEVCKTPIAIDSQKLNVIKAGIEVVAKGSNFLINSCPLNTKKDPEVLEKYLALCQEHNASLVALTMDREGVPQNVEKRVEIAAAIVEKAMTAGVSTDKLFIDPIILPINVSQNQPTFLLEVMSQVKLLADPRPHMTVGLSNLSQGASERSLINRTFLVMAIAVGLDSAIVDVFDTELMDAAITAEMLLNKQIYSDSFLKAARMR